MRCYLKILQRYPICLKEVFILKVLFNAEIKYKLNTLLWESRRDDCVLMTKFFCCFLGYIYTFLNYKTILLPSTGYSDSKILWVWHRSSNVRIEFPAFWPEFVTAYPSYTSYLQSLMLQILTRILLREGLTLRDWRQQWFLIWLCGALVTAYKHLISACGV